MPCEAQEHDKNMTNPGACSLQSPGPVQSHTASMAAKAAHPRLRMAMTISSKLLLPARSPMPLMVHSS